MGGEVWRPGGRAPHAGGRAESRRLRLRSRVRGEGGKAPPRGGRGRRIKGHPGGRGPGQQPSPRAHSAPRRPARVPPAPLVRRPGAARPAERSRAPATGASGQGAERWRRCQGAGPRAPDGGCCWRCWRWASCRGRRASRRFLAARTGRARASRWSPSNGTTSRTRTSSRSGSSWPVWPRSVSRPGLRRRAAASPPPTRWVCGSLPAPPAGRAGCLRRLLHALRRVRGLPCGRGASKVGCPAVPSGSVAANPGDSALGSLRAGLGDCEPGRSRSGSARGRGLPGPGRAGAAS